MVKAVGTDSGTGSMDLFGFDDESGEVFLDEAILRDEITEEPEIVIERLEKVQEEQGDLDCIVASSGYGIPCKKARDASIEEVNMATFMTEEDFERGLKIVGLRKLMMEMREAENLNIYFTPGVIQIPTVPERRKANRVDLGTSDKVYTAALAVKDQAERRDIEPCETSAVAVEIGFAYTSSMAIEKGKIVDAMAGTAGFPGYMGMGFMDSELAYALGNTFDDLSKMSIFQGGGAYLSGLDPLESGIEEFPESGGEGYEMMLEAVVKDVAALLPATEPEEIVLSGRFTKISRFVEDLKLRLQNFFEILENPPEIVNLRHRGEVCKEAAEGSAVVANGIAGGIYEEIVDEMRIMDSEGAIFDHLCLGDEYLERLEHFEK